MTPGLTSLGEAAVETQATDQKRRETPTIRPGLVGTRRDPKWLDSENCPTLYSAKAQLEGELQPTMSYAPSYLEGHFYWLCYASRNEGLAVLDKEVVVWTK